ncbi:hypothetical protein ACFWFI_36520 [Streptomyces sp. NPDC060209]|uniref:hypothetical protein n=1 Tax=Streptomyces sp. NPDC060209 TaxID=3347073 RepID=UPI00366765BF
MLEPISSLTLLVLLVAAMVAVIVALLVGAATIYLSRRDGATWPSALIRGGIAFSGMLTLLLLAATLAVVLLQLRS